MTYKIGDLALLTIDSAAGKARTLLERAKKKLGFVPNMYGAMANEPALFETYDSGYDAFRAECGFTPVEQEVIFLVVSRENGCDYCMAAHSFLADVMAKAPTETTDAIRDGRPIKDSKIAALAAFASVMVDSRGRPTEADVAAFKAAGFSERNILGVILAISVKTLSNYTNHIFDTPVDAAFAGRIWKAAA